MAWVDTVLSVGTEVRLDHHGGSAAQETSGQ
eukprot:CAMPEP_0172798358 /NCGR_PEP_ID=MMETSP1075-20121228/1102_1 /TAXON_ID=2916 /ORGANISM="Ceratium fusus, Strain PA161109" /LENGTH=30 /DNA_ID= /DNA_START= /DNA_END= /DNA_ORIENTATION=